ncbi:hypothetical protein AAFF_G00331540 [Aldrovandia affinis]|uniref:Uncharacterized protein n=1 Tax=Aldrovandia affinis TaxID=143900 RepID=A0AAD7SMJ6_9TELE|nr:hypothetical protein AAFF_G00331540 [Aldrovandia affinis]
MGALCSGRALRNSPGFKLGPALPPAPPPGAEPQRDNAPPVLHQWTHAAPHQRINSPSLAGDKGSHFLATGRAQEPSSPSRDGAGCRSGSSPGTFGETVAQNSPRAAFHRKHTASRSVSSGWLGTFTQGPERLHAVRGVARASNANQALSVYLISISLTTGALWKASASAMVSPLPGPTPSHRLTAQAAARDRFEPQCARSTPFARRQTHIPICSVFTSGLTHKHAAHS